VNIRSLTDGPLDMPTADGLRAGLQIPPDRRSMKLRLAERERDRIEMRNGGKPRNQIKVYGPDEHAAIGTAASQRILAPDMKHYVPGCTFELPHYESDSEYRRY